MIFLLIKLLLYLKSWIFVAKRARKKAVNKRIIIEVSSRAPVVSLDPSIVQNYIDGQNKNTEEEKENVPNIADKENESVIDLEAVKDDSVEYVGTSTASPRTKKIASMNKRIYLLENQIAGMKKGTKAKKNHSNQSNASASSIEPQSSFSSGASTSSSSLNSTNSMADFNASDLGGFDEEEVNKLVDEWHGNGQLLDIAKEVIDFCQQQQ